MKIVVLVFRNRKFQFLEFTKIQDNLMTFKKKMFFDLRLRVQMFLWLFFFHSVSHTLSNTLFDVIQFLRIGNGRIEISFEVQRRSWSSS
jgi:hypothetical protein